MSDHKILEWDDLAVHVREQWQKRATGLTLPPVSFDGRHDQVSPKELAEKITHDPALCAKILAVANSAAQGQINPVLSIDRAVIQLGANMLQIILSAYHLETVLGRFPDYSRQHFQFVRKWASGASVLAYHLSAKSKVPDRGMLSTAALISRLGCLIFGLTWPEPDVNYHTLPFETQRNAYEMSIWGISSPILSERVAIHWGLPEPLPMMLRCQEQPLHVELEDTVVSRQLLIICLAHVITAAFLNGEEDSPVQVIHENEYEILYSNADRYQQLLQPLGEAWDSTGLQREFRSLFEMSE